MDIKKIIKETVTEALQELQVDNSSVDTLNRPRIRMKIKHDVQGSNLFGGKDFIAYVKNGDWFFVSPFIGVHQDAVQIIGPSTELPDSFE